MATIEPLLQITDTVTTVTLMDNTLTTNAQKLSMPYRLSYDTWSPKISQRNKSPFGLPYMPVMEEMTIDIKGTTPDDALNKLQLLNSLLDQGERWFNNEQVKPVFIRYQPKGSAKSTYMKDMIIGRGFGDQSDLMDLPSNFELVGSYFWIRGIRIRFWRKNGIWLCEDETQVVGAFVTQPGPGVVTFTNAAPVLSPVNVQLGQGSASASVSNLCSGFIIVTQDDRYIGVVEGASGVTVYSLTGTVSTNDASHFPTNAKVGNVGATATYVDTIITVLTPLEECEYCAIYATVRNNSTVNDVYLQASIWADKRIVLQEVRIAAAATPKPQAIFLGVFPTSGRRPNTIQISYKTLTSTASFDFDQVLLVGVNRATTIIAIPTLNAQTGLNSTHTNILHRLLNEPQGEVSYNIPTSDTQISYSGSPYVFTGGSGGLGSQLKCAVAMLMVDDDCWQIVNGTRAAAITYNLTVTRSKAYLVPE